MDCPRTRFPAGSDLFTGQPRGTKKNDLLVWKGALGEELADALLRQRAEDDRAGDAARIVTRHAPHFRLFSGTLEVVELTA